MHKLFYYYGVYCFCLAIHDALHDALEEIHGGAERKRKEVDGSQVNEKERRIKPKEHYNAKGEPMAKIGF